MGSVSESLFLASSLTLQYEMERRIDELEIEIPSPWLTEKQKHRPS